MRTARERRTELELDAAIDSLAGRGGSAGRALPDRGELAGLCETALLVRRHAGDEPLAPLASETGDEGAAPQGARHRPGLGRVAAAALLVAAAAVGALLARADHSVQSPASGTGRCLGQVRAVETDGAHLPAPVLTNVLLQARAGGDPCPALPVLWVATTWAKAGWGPGGTPGGPAYAVELRGTFYSDPYRRSGRPSHESRLLASRNVSVIVGGFSGPIGRLGTVHELYLRPVPAPPRPPSWMLRELQAAASGSRQPVRVRWVETTLPELRRIAPGVHWAASEYQGDRYRAYVAELFGAGLAGGRPSLFDVFIEGSSLAPGTRRPIGLDGGGLQAGVPRAWKPVAALLRRSSAHTWWLPAPLPTSLPAWVRREVELNLPKGPGRPSVRWLVTTAGRLERLAPYETAVPATMPSPTPVWIVEVSSARSRAVTTLVYTRYPGRSGIDLGSGGLELPPGRSLSALGTFRTARIAPS
ncbi:MAG TPA: hypothetical protein VKU92_07850 [Acidimicrobiales bacterium]|nr:hypothetical protein [Acidimicrobiales bacterium]